MQSIVQKHTLSWNPDDKASPPRAKPLHRDNLVYFNPYASIDKQESLFGQSRGQLACSGVRPRTQLRGSFQRPSQMTDGASAELSAGSIGTRTIEGSIEGSLPERIINNKQKRKLQRRGSTHKTRSESNFARPATVLAANPTAP